MVDSAVRQIKDADLKAAQEGSWYTILGTGGPLDEWVEGYEKILAEAGIGKPVAWYKTTGRTLNEFIGPKSWRDAFDSGLTALMFPLDGLNVGRLAAFRISMSDRWFDDIVDNARGGAR